MSVALHWTHSPAPSTTYVPSLDGGMSGAAALIRTELLGDVEGSSSSWTARRMERANEDVQAAMETARRRGILIPSTAAEVACSILWALPSYVPLPDVHVEDDGYLALDWDEAADRVLSVSTNGAALVGFAGLYGREELYGRARVVRGAIPELVLQPLQRLYAGSNIIAFYGSRPR